MSLYRTLDSDLSQGDIIDDVPHVHFKTPIEILRSFTGKGGRVMWGGYPYPPEEGKTPDAPGKSVEGGAFHVKFGEFVRTNSVFTRAIVLSYDCDLVNDDKEHCLIALVKPISAFNEIDRPTIRRNQNFTQFFLPSSDEFGLTEGVVDFRRVTTVTQDVISRVGRRIASMNADGIALLHACLYRFLTRRDLAAAE